MVRMIINLIVGVYISIIRIPVIKAGRSRLSPICTFLRWILRSSPRWWPLVPPPEIRGSNQLETEKSPRETKVYICIDIDIAYMYIIYI